MRAHPLIAALFATLALPAAAHGHDGVTHGEALVNGRMVEVPASAPHQEPPATTQTRAGSVAYWKATGPRDVAVVPVLLDGAAPVVASTLRSVFFDGANSASAWFGEVTNGVVTLQGDVLDPVSLTAGATSCNWSSWGSQAASAVGARGTKLSSYDNVVYLFQGTTRCGWAGLAYMPGTKSYLNATTNLGVVVHELGHNFGLDHASVWDCYDGQGARVALSASCTLDEYGDPFDAMGSGSRLNSAPHRDRGGWLPASAIATADRSTTYRLGPVAEAGTLPRMLRVPRPDGSILALELRRPFGVFDAFSASETVVNGVTVRVHQESSRVQTRLIDMTPATWSVADAPLVAGASLTDPASGWTITLQAIDALGATIRLNTGAPDPAPTAAAPVPAAAPPAPAPESTPPPPPTTVTPPEVELPPLNYVYLPEARRAVSKPLRQAKGKKAAKKKRAKRRRSQSRRRR